MTRIATAVVAVLALLFAGCGGSDEPVEGSTTPPTVATTGTQTAKAPTVDLAKLRACVGGTDAEIYKWFAPTLEYAKAQGGDGFTVMLKKRPVTLMSFPTPEAAQTGYKDISDRVIALQQRRPTDYAQIAAIQMQVVGTVLEISTSGALPPKATNKIVGCLQQSAT